MRANVRHLAGLVTMAALTAACSSASKGGDLFVADDAGGGGEGGNAGEGGSGGGGGSAGSAGGGGSAGSGGAAGAGGGSGSCTATADEDRDHDGVTVAQGDCNDCDPDVGPGAFDWNGDGVDQDCSGHADDEPSGCDVALPLDATDPFDAAKSLGLCRMQSGSGWGLVSARWAFPDGTSTSLAAGAFGTSCTGAPPSPDSRGILASFGSAVQPKQGQSMLALSSGVARSGVQTSTSGSGDSPSGAQTCTASEMPTGFPKPLTACSPVPSTTDAIAKDGIALELTIRVPTNARSLAFDFDFFTYEFPAYVCSEYNDSFAAILSPAPAGVGADGNITFDAKGSPIGASSGLLAVCNPQTAGGLSFGCGKGIGELAGTGFDAAASTTATPHAATGWVRTQSPVAPGQLVTLRFAIWDAGDEVLDSTVLVDGFGWLPAATLSPVTTPLP